MLFIFYCLLSDQADWLADWLIDLSTVTSLIKLHKHSLNMVSIHKNRGKIIFILANNGRNVATINCLHSERFCTIKHWQKRKTLWDKDGFWTIPERAKLHGHNKSNMLTNVTWSAWQRPAPRHSFIITLCKAKLPIKHRLPPPQGRPTVRHKPWRPLRGEEIF